MSIAEQDESDWENSFQELLELSEDWQSEANCRGVNPNLFYPERGVSTVEAKEVCAGCQVKRECLEFAVQKGEKFGIWGGMSERERRRIRRLRHRKSQIQKKSEEHSKRANLG